MAPHRGTIRGRKETGGLGRAVNTERTAATPAWIGLAVFALALSVRLAYLYDSSDNPTFLVPIVDSHTYDGLARDFVAGKGMTEGFFWQSFFYPLFLSIVYMLTDCSIVWVKVVQALVGAFTCLLVYRVGVTALERRTGILAGLLCACYGPLVFFEGELLAEGWATFWSVVLLLCLVRRGRASGPRSFSIGMFGALTCISRGPFLLFVASAFAWEVLRTYRGTRRRLDALNAMIWLSAGFLLVSAPIAIQSYRVTGRFGILPANGPLNLYIGNNPQVCRTLTARPGPSYDLLQMLPEQHGITGPALKRRFYYRLVWDYAIHHPFSFGMGLADKAVQFVSSREIPNSLTMYLFRRWSPLLSALVWKVGKFGFPFGLLFPLAVVGLVACARRLPAPLWLLLLLYPLGIIMVHVNDRYRVPVAPALCLLAAAGCWSMVDMLRRRRWRSASTSFASVTVMACLISLAGPFCLEDLPYEAEMHGFLGSTYWEQHKNIAKARVALQQAIELDPDYAEAYYNRGTICAETGDFAGAMRNYTRAIELKPYYAKAYMNRGNTHYWLQEYDRALADYDQTLALAPAWGLAYCNRGAARHKLGLYAGAIEDYTRGIQLMPDHADAYHNRARSYCSLKEYDKAWADIEKCRQLGGRPDPEFLKTLTQASGRPE